MNSLIDRVMEWPWVYRLWMAPFAEQKVRPIRDHVDLSLVRRVLDVGCGPGTNTALFTGADYLGIDINESYIESARRRHRRTFVAADVTTYRVADHQRFDLILVNSLLHHLDDASTVRLLKHLSRLLSDDGRVHILELVLPAGPSPARFLARHDRGKFVRPLDRWTMLLGSVLEPVLTELYGVGVPGVTLWNMVYFMGKSKAVSSQLSALSQRQ
jgi:SAM-dependent methyltransferase